MYKCTFIIINYIEMIEKIIVRNYIVFSEVNQELMVCSTTEIINHDEILCDYNEKKFEALEERLNNRMQSFNELNTWSCVYDALNKDFILNMSDLAQLIEWDDPSEAYDLIARRIRIEEEGTSR
jgi:hypothetical protein